MRLSFRGQLPAAPTDDPTLLSLVEVLPPRKAIANRHTMAIKPTRRAYSTRLAPRSSVIPNRAVRYLPIASKSISGVSRR